MKNLYNRFWIRVTIGLSVLVAVVGFPAFQHTKGFPGSLLWTLAVIAGVWLTYLIRAWAWSTHDKEKTGAQSKDL